MRHKSENCYFIFFIFFFHFLFWSRREISTVGWWECNIVCFFFWWERQMVRGEKGKEKEKRWDGDGMEGNNGVRQWRDRQKFNLEWHRYTIKWKRRSDSQTGGEREREMRNVIEGLGKWQEGFAPPPFPPSVCPFIRALHQLMQYSQADSSLHVLPLFTPCSSHSRSLIAHSLCFLSFFVSLSLSPSFLSFFVWQLTNSAPGTAAPLNHLESS